jgi:hypothetical protein
MQGDNGLVTVASNQPANANANALNANDAATQKVDFVRQLTGAGSNTEGGLFAQLSSNPLFTGVCSLDLPVEPF